MPSHCCVPYCNTNYPSGPRLSVFSFPKNEDLIKKWISVIPKKNFQPTPGTKVCQRHFTADEVIKETSGYDSKKKITITVPLKTYRLKPDAVPSIFEDLPLKHSKKVRISALKESQGKDNIENVGTSMQKKVTKDKGNKSPKKVLATDQTARAVSPKKPLSTSDCISDVSPSKSPLTTDRPIIAVIKAEDCMLDDDKSSDKMDVDDVTESPGSKPFTLPSPFKNLPSVSVCLKEEDRVPFTRELKGVKRSPSTGSNSSTGSTDAQKLGTSLTKRKKIEKPAPVVIGRQNDCYCWVCHRENIVLCCIACPRAYHNKCAGQASGVLRDWVCPECQRVLAAENVDTRSSTLSEISLDKLGALLKLSLNKMKQRAPIAFHQPVSLEHYPLYLHYVIHPMDFSLLEKNIKQKMYGCTEAFLADVKWIAHNSCVFNGTQHPLSTNAKNLVKSCDQDMQEIEVCPDCFVHSVVRNKYWFSEVCRKPHPLVWAKLKGFPYWPAKVVRNLDGNVDARFFGAHDRAWVPVSQCYHLSKEMPTTSKPKKKGNYEVALDELNVHVHLLMQKFGCFEYAPYRTSFNILDNKLMYHGIDIDKASKEEISIDNSTSQSEMKFLNSEKENRFANFMESESEKSNADESNLSKIQSEVQQNSSLKGDVSSKPFFLKERSTDSVLSEKEISNNSFELRTSNEDDKTKQKPDAAKSSLIKEPEKISDSDQLRKLELALERIKGYVSLNDDTEKETSEVRNDEKEEKKAENEKIVSPERGKDNFEKTKLSPLFKRMATLPVIESNNTKESVEDISVPLQSSSNTDSFFLKLNETIESCKAKLGISEINDDISSDESAGDENGSRSDEDDSTASEGEEEESDEEEGENVGVSDEEVENEDEEVENEDEENKVEDKSDSTDSEEEDSESDEESNSHSTDTDIETANKISPKRPETPAIQNNVDNENDTRKLNRNEDEDCVKELSIDSSEAIVTNPDMQVPEVTIGDSGSLQISGENSSSESINEVKENSKSVPTELCSVLKSPQTVTSSKKDSPVSTSQSLSSLNASKGNSSYTVEVNDKTASTIDFSSVSHKHAFSSNDNNSSSVKIPSSSNVSIDERLNNNMKENSHVEKREDSQTNCKKEEEDDEVIIYTPTRPKSPPVIVLDDEPENEDSSVSDTFAIRSPPFSTSAESFSDEETPPMRTNFVVDRNNSLSKVVSDNHQISNEKSEKKIEINGNVSNENRTIHSENLERRKRKFSSCSSSEDEIQIVTPVKKPALTGAIRTFKPSNNAPSLKPSTPTLESVKRNLEKESLKQINKSPSPTKSSGVAMEGNNSAEKQKPASLNPENCLRSPVIDGSNLTDKDKEILFLRGKLNCIMTAYKIQSWKCNQEREELRHNMNLIIMEMRASLESDKKQAIEALVRNHEKEKQKFIDETKRKQWCASCLKESRYACCWNTSYCSIDCQKCHFPEHRNSCTQVRKKNIEIQPIAAKSSESNENKKLIILNMKSSDNNQQNPVTKPQIQLLPSKNALQMASTSSSHNNIQFLLAQPPLKSPTELPVIQSIQPTATTSKEQNLDSAQIINQVRNKSCGLDTAITLLKKKNIETSVSLKKKEEKEKATEEINLEEIYFPSPPAVTFEGYESASPDPNLVIMENEETNPHYDAQSLDPKNPKYLPPEPDLLISDGDDIDNEMVNIGYGLDVKAKSLNKCLAYGHTAKKLTRALMDVFFGDLKLLASCSALGHKSNVTKLTRAALPTRKVHAIIDFVRKRFPECTKSEIVFTINMKCKEARIMQSKKGKRALAREKKELKSTVNATAVTVASLPVTTTSQVIASSINKVSPNVVCVKSSDKRKILPFSVPIKPNILRCNPQILLKPKPLPNTITNAAVIQTPSAKRGETVKTLLANKSMLTGGGGKDGTKLVVTVETLKQCSASAHPVTVSSTHPVTVSSTQPLTIPSTQPVVVSSTSATNVKPYIIIGPHINAVRPASSMAQHPAFPISSNIKK